MRHRAFSLSAQNTFSPWITLKRGGVITIEGTWSATMTLQRRGADGVIVDATNNTPTVVTYTANGTYTIDPNFPAADYRVGIKTMAYTSGTATGIIEGR